MLHITLVLLLFTIGGPWFIDNLFGPSTEGITAMFVFFFAMMIVWLAHAGVL